MVLFSDLGESVLLIARFTPHPLADIRQGYWLEKFEFERERVLMLAVEEGYAREEERRAKRARLDISAMLRAEVEEEAAKYGVFLD